MPGVSGVTGSCKGLIKVHSASRRGSKGFAFAMVAKGIVAQGCFGREIQGVCFEV